MCLEYCIAVFALIRIANVATIKTKGVADRATPAIPVKRIATVIAGPITAKP